MSEELELATLYSDDRLLDSLAGRTDVPDPDLVAGLLAAFAAEVDTYPVMLSEALLVTVPSQPHHAAAPAPTVEAAPAHDEPTPITAAQTKRHQLIPRTAAAASVVAVVLGLGGAAAAVGGDVGPLRHLKNAVVSVTDQVVPGHSREKRVAEYLDEANVALRHGELRTASFKAGQAKQNLLGLTGAMAEALKAELDTVLSRIDGAFARAAAVSANSGIPIGSTISSPRTPGSQPTARPGAAVSGHPQTTGHPASATTAAATEQGSASPTAAPTHQRLGEGLAETGLDDPTQDLPKVPGEPGIGEAKERIKDKAQDQLEPLPEKIPDPMGPVGPWRHPANEAVFENPAVAGVIGGLGGDALKSSNPYDVASGLTGGELKE